MYHLVEIEKIPSPDVVRDVSLDDPLNAFKIFQQMEKVCVANNGIGLAAVQIGLPLKLFVVRNDNKYECYANVNYRSCEPSQVMTSLEGCLSIRSPRGQLRHFQVQRYKKILISGYKLRTTPELSFERFEDIELGLRENSIVFQHEIDHQLGILISDIGKEVTIW